MFFFYINLQCIVYKWSEIGKEYDKQLITDAFLFFLLHNIIFPCSLTDKKILQNTNFREKEKEILDRVMDPKRSVWFNS